MIPRKQDFATKKEYKWAIKLYWRPVAVAFVVIYVISKLGNSPDSAYCNDTYNWI